MGSRYLKAAPAATVAMRTNMTTPTTVPAADGAATETEAPRMRSLRRWLMLLISVDYAPRKDAPNFCLATYVHYRVPIYFGLSEPLARTWGQRLQAPLAHEGVRAVVPVAVDVPHLLVVGQHDAVAAVVGWVASRGPLGLQDQSMIIL